MSNRPKNKPQRYWRTEWLTEWMKDKAHRDLKNVPWQRVAYWGISYPMRNLGKKLNLVNKHEGWKRTEEERQRKVERVKELDDIKLKYIFYLFYDFI